MEPKVIRPDEARSIELYDVVFKYGIGTGETDGRLSMLEVTIPPKTLIKPHTHTREDEFSLVLAGPIGLRSGDDTVEEVPTGSWLVKPRNVPHAMWNLSDDPRACSRWSCRAVWSVISRRSRRCSGSTDLSGRSATRRWRRSTASRSSTTGPMS